MRSQPRKNLRGATLLEMIIATGLLAMLGSSAFRLSDSLTGHVRTETVSADLDRTGRATMVSITSRLRASDANAVTPAAVTLPDSTSWLDFQRCIGIAGTDVQWGNPERLVFEYDVGEVDDGVDNDGDGLIDEGRVVLVENPSLPGERRRVLCNWVSESLEGEVPGNLVDDNGNGLVDEPGFCIHFDGRRATARLTLARMDSYGNLVEHTFLKSVALRNTQ